MEIRSMGELNIVCETNKNSFRDSSLFVVLRGKKRKVKVISN